MSTVRRDSRIAAACELLGWAAVAVALLFQNPYGEIGPEADRFLALQILAVIALVLVAVEIFGHSGASALALRELAAAPLARWALAWGGAAAVATVASVDPLRSLYGAPPRLFGLASEIALLVLFFVLAPSLREASRRERLETAGLAAAGAMVAYALVQWAGLDPLRWQVDWQGRPIAAQGNPLFLAQALIFLIPVAAGRAIARWRAGERAAALAASGLALAAAVVAVRTAARGPLLGLGVAAVVFAALAGLSSPRAAARRAGAALAALLICATVAGSALAWQGADRLTGTAGQRWLLWGSVVRLLEASPPSRLVIGFGPESLPIVLPPHLPPELPERTWRPDLYHDRAHNAELDALAVGGLLRLVALLGLAITAGWSVLRLAGVCERSASAGGERWRFVALGAALGGQAVAAQFGVATAATATLVWLTLALLAGALSSSAETAAAASAGPQVPAPAPGKRAARALRRGAQRATRGREFAAAGLLALVAFGAWVPVQQEGDAMGGRVFLLLVLAAGGIALGFASAGTVAGGRSEGGRPVARPGALSARRKAGTAAVILAALASLAFVQLPQIASGVELKRGRTAVEAGRPDLAVGILARAERLCPAFEDPSIALARAEQRVAERAGGVALREAAFERAAATLAAARRRHPGLPQLVLEEAHLAARRADGAASPEVKAALFEGAVLAYRAVLLQDPQSSTVHRGLGAALLALGRLDEAGRELEASVRLAPRSLESWLLLGRLRLSAGADTAAREAFQAARELDATRSRRLLEGLVRARPGDPEALRDLALFEIVEGRRKEAIAALERAMALTRPQDLPPLVRLTGLASALP